MSYRICPICKGRKIVERYPYYATHMPEKKQCECEACRGSGEIFVIPDNVVIIKESEFKKFEKI